MGRRSKGDAGGASLDSLLDTMTNVVGILIIVMVVTQLGVRDAVDRITTTSDVDTEDIEAAKQQVEDAKQARLEQEKARENLLAQLEAFSDEAKAKEQLEILNGQLNLNRSDLNKILNNLKSQEAAQKKKIQDADMIAKQYKEKEKQVKELTTKVVAANGQLATLKAQLEDTPMREVLDAKVVNLPNPRKAPEGATAKYMICREGKVYPWNRDELRKVAQQKAELIVVNRNLAANAKAGIDPMKLIPMFAKPPRLNDNWFLLKLRANGRQPLVVYERKKNAGYDIKIVENPRGPFHKLLATIDPNKHYLRFTVWNDSYEVYLAARQAASQHGILAGWDITSMPGEIEIALGGKIQFGPPPPPPKNPPKPNPNPNVPKPPAREVPTDTID